jgi:hypothetical protein
MRTLLFALLLSWLPNLCSAQLSPDKKEHPRAADTNLKKSEKKTVSTQETVTLTPEQIKTVEENAAKKAAYAEGNPILKKYLGISSTKDPLYATKKEQLKNEHPESYKKMIQELKGNPDAQQRQISRADYEKLPAEKKAKLDSFNYEIID